MRYSLFCVAGAGLLASTTAYAENEAAPAAAASASAPVIKVGSTLRSAEGRRIGTTQRQLKAENGAPTTFTVIFDPRCVYIPVSTLSQSDTVLGTSLTNSEINKLRKNDMTSALHLVRNTTPTISPRLMSPD